MLLMKNIMYDAFSTSQDDLIVFGRHYPVYINRFENFKTLGLGIFG